ncbi:cell wall-binding repeat-containing protein, partial [Microbacterium sp.]|uniref:cell wall-binding repeat-containing protein n=1 Tax=Microbacterium sp. TaxID=51671 RepID=UPI003A854EA6
MRSAASRRARFGAAMLRAAILALPATAAFAAPSDSVTPPAVPQAAAPDGGGTPTGGPEVSSTPAPDGAVEPTPGPGGAVGPDVSATPEPDGAVAPDGATEPDGAVEPESGDPETVLPGTDQLRQLDATPDAVAGFAETAATIPSASRVSGSTRYDTAVRATRAVYPSGAAVVVVASGNELTQSIAAAGVAAAIGAPLLPVTASSVPSVVAQELVRLAPQRILVVGPTSSVSTTVGSRLREITSDVTRLSGSDVYALSHAALPRFHPRSDVVYVAG